MACLKWITMVILVQLPAVVNGENVDPARCTRYASIDLYILLDVYPEDETVHMAFKFVENFVKLLDLNRTGVAFWTGNLCTRGQQQFKLCTSTENFRFLYFLEKGNLEDILNQLSRIKTILTPTGNRTEGSEVIPLTQLFSRVLERDKLTAGITYLDLLEQVKRDDAELVLLLLSSGYRKNDPDSSRLIMTSMRNMSRFAIQLRNTLVDPPDLDSLDPSLFASQVNHVDHYHRDHIDRVSEPGTAAEMLSMICRSVLSCHYEVNESAKVMEHCRWSLNGDCLKDMSGSIKIRKEPERGQTPCPATSESCPADQCNVTCETIDMLPWQNWSPCVCDKNMRSKVRSSRKSSEHISKKCATTVVENCKCTTTTSTTMSTSTTATTTTSSATTTPKPKAKTSTSTSTTRHMSASTWPSERTTTRMHSSSRKMNTSSGSMHTRAYISSSRGMNTSSSGGTGNGVTKDTTVEIVMVLITLLIGLVVIVGAIFFCCKKCSKQTLDVDEKRTKSATMASPSAKKSTSTAAPEMKDGVDKRKEASVSVSLSPSPSPSPSPSASMLSSGGSFREKSFSAKKTG